MNAGDGNSGQEPKPDYPQYVEERKLLIQQANENGMLFSKAILSFGSGAFAVSIAFLKDVIPFPFKNTLWLLGWSWTLFSCSLIVILVGFLLGQKACEAQDDVNYEALVNMNRNVKNKWRIWARLLGIASIISLTTAFVFAGLFVYWNKIYPQIVR